MRKIAWMALTLTILALAGCGASVATSPPVHHKAHTTKKNPPPPPPPQASVAFSGTLYREYGRIEFECQVGTAKATNCIFDTGTPSGFAIDAQEAKAGGFTEGRPFNGQGASGSGTNYETSGTITIDGQSVSGDGAIVPAMPGPGLSAGVIEGAFGPVFSVTPKTDTMQTAQAPTDPQNVLNVYAGSGVAFPCNIEGENAGLCELDTGTIDGLLMSTAQAKALGLTLGAPVPVLGSSGVTVTAYRIMAKVTPGNLAPIALTGVAVPEYQANIIIGTPFIKAEWPNGWVFDSIDGTISALPN